LPDSLPTQNRPNSEKTNFNTLVNTRLAFKEFYIADAKRAYADNLPTVGWAHYAGNQIVTAFNEDGEYSPRVDSMVESLESDRKVFNCFGKALG